MNEAETRAELIDPLLTAAGLGVVEGSRIRREFPITPGRIEGGGKRGKALTADYVLTYRNTQLAVVEAKPNTAPLTEGVAQAKDSGEARARRLNRLPMVLTMEDVRLPLQRMEVVEVLVAQMLHGSGMRLMEALRLQVLAARLPLSGGMGTLNGRRSPSVPAMVIKTGLRRCLLI